VIASFEDETFEGEAIDAMASMACTLAASPSALLAFAAALSLGTDRERQKHILLPYFKGQEWYYAITAFETIMASANFKNCGDHFEYRSKRGNQCEAPPTLLEFANAPGNLSTHSHNHGGGNGSKMFSIEQTFGNEMSGKMLALAGFSAETADGFGRYNFGGMAMEFDDKWYRKSLVFTGLSGTATAGRTLEPIVMGHLEYQVFDKELNETYQHGVYVMVDGKKRFTAHSPHQDKFAICEGKVCRNSSRHELVDATMLVSIYCWVVGSTVSVCTPPQVALIDQSFVDHTEPPAQSRRCVYAMFVRNRDRTADAADAAGAANAAADESEVDEPEPEPESEAESEAESDPESD
jgi:hypothetical protein